MVFTEYRNRLIHTLYDQYLYTLSSNPNSAFGFEFLFQLDEALE